MRLVLALFLSSAALGAAPAPRPFPAGGHAAPADRLFVPSHPKVPAALVVMLHGCEQDADASAVASGWDELAEREGFYVLYPNQQWGRNPYNCWNWFLPYNQAPGFGEPGEIAASVFAAEALHPVDRSRVYAAGLSSGGAEAAIMLACYHDLFAGGLVHSGVSYALATDAAGALDVLKNGPGDRKSAGLCDPAAFRGALLVLHGADDKAVAPSNAARVAADFSGARAKTVLVPGLGHAWAPDAAKTAWEYWSARPLRP